MIFQKITEETIKIILNDRKINKKQIDNLSLKSVLARNYAIYLLLIYKTMPFKIFKGIYKELNSYNDINLFDKKVYLENNYLKAKRLIKNDLYINEYSIINYLSILISLKKTKY